MSKQNVIKQGYRVTLTTWENDADNYNTATVDGLSEQQVKFWVDIFEAFKSCHYEGGLGNMHSSRSEELVRYHEVIAGIARNHYNAVFSLFGFDPVETDMEDSEISDRISDSFYDWTLQGSEDFFTRVADEWKIEYVPTEIILNDVTSEFQTKRKKRK